MINFRIISKIIGSLLFIEAFFMTWCAALAFYFHEDDQIAFVISLLITFGSGFLFLLFFNLSLGSLSNYLSSYFFWCTEMYTHITFRWEI